MDYIITAPDGRKFRVSAPDDATQEEVLAYAQANAPPLVAEKAAPTVPPPEDVGAMQAGVIGAGRVLDRTLQGLKQAGLGGLSTVNALLGRSEAAAANEADLARMKETQAENTAFYRTLEKQHPVATTVGEMVPLITALPAVSGVGSAAAISAIPGLVEYGTPEERLTRGALGAAGGALGAGLGKVVGRALQPFRPQPSETQAAAQAAAQRLGVQLRPGEITGSRPLQWFESSLNDLPFSGGMAHGQEAARRAAINEAGARAIGTTAPELTEGVLAKARTDIGNVFDNLLKGRRIELGPKFRADVQQIVDSKVLPALRDESVDAVIAPFQNLPAGKVKVSGEWFQQNKTALDMAIRSAYNNSQPGKAMALEAFENALSQAATDSMNATERAAYNAAQKQWASLRLLETGKVIEGGNVMPGRLDTALISRYKAAYKEGKIPGELADIGKLAQVYKPLPQSGTVPRAVYSGTAAGASFAHPALTAAMLAAPPLAQRFLQSPGGRRYLAQGLLTVTPDIEKRLMQSTYGLFGVPPLAGLMLD